MRDSRDLDDGENTQNSNIVKSFHPISRYRSIKGTPYETRASHEQNIGSLMTPVKWEQSCGPGIWAEIIQPYEKKKSLPKSITAAMAAASTIRQGVRIPDFSWGHGRMINGTFEMHHIGGCGENKKQMPYGTVEEQETSEFVGQHKKALAKAAWYLSITNQLCGCRHGVAMVNWSFQRLFIRNDVAWDDAQRDCVMYIETAWSGDDASDDPNNHANLAEGAEDSMSAKEIFDSDIFGIHKLPHRTRDYGAGSETNINRGAAAALWNYVMSSYKDTVASARALPPDSERLFTAPQAVSSEGNRQQIEKFGARMIAPSGQDKQTEAEPQPASKTNARKREYEDEDDGPTAKWRTAPASRARSAVHNGKSYCRAITKQTNHIPRRSTHNQPRRPGIIHSREWPLSKVTGRRNARQRKYQITASYFLTKLSQHIYDTNGILRKYLAKLHCAVDPDSLPPLVACENQHMSHDAFQEDVDFSQETFESPLLGRIQDGAGTGCQTITLDAELLPSDSYSQASEDGRTCFSYVSLLQRMNVKFQLITPETMDAIYRNIADEKKDPFEGIYTIRPTA
jgi:hypothetical protein